ncbi:hypothetical protein [Streptomyces sp. AS58]|uniref:hypothetical protein n=1 Tax=Streptomyces sp. AS58 TaxID=1519489 RepID=UPI00131C2755|nr:hypothetical protein [Streptomyces sp. AS58]
MRLFLVSSAGIPRPSDFLIAVLIDSEEGEEDRERDRFVFVPDSIFFLRRGVDQARFIP